MSWRGSVPVREEGSSREHTVDAYGAVPRAATKKKIVDRKFDTIKCKKSKTGLRWEIDFAVDSGVVPWVSPYSEDSSSTEVLQCDDGSGTVATANSFVIALSLTLTALALS